MKLHHHNHHCHLLLRRSIQLSTSKYHLVSNRFIIFDDDRRALEIALLLKEHPDCACVLVTLIQEYQSRSVQLNIHVSCVFPNRLIFYLLDFKNHFMLVNFTR